MTQQITNLARTCAVALLAIGTATELRSAQPKAPSCATGIIQMPTNINGKVEICGALLAQNPSLDRQLNDIVSGLGEQRADLERLIRGINGVGKNLSEDRQATLLAKLSSTLTSQQQADNQQIRRQIASLTEAIDALRDQMLNSLTDRASADRALTAIDGPVGDAIAQLDFAGARDQLQQLSVQLEKIDAKVTDIQRTIERQVWNVQTISSALAAGDTLFLQQLPTAQIPLSVISEALSTPSGDSLVSARFFENTRDSGAALAWLSAAMDAGVSPNLIIRGLAYRREALLNPALRGSNRKAAELLLRRGASPHAYQELERTRFADARFLFPLIHIAKNDEFSAQEKRDLVDAFVRAGVVVPAVVAPPKTQGWKSVMATAREQRETLERLGITAPESPRCCTSAMAKLCSRFQAPGAAKWCQSLSTMPRYLTPVAEDYGRSPLRSVELQYLLDITDSSAFFLALEEPKYNPDYVVVEILRDGSSWFVFKHMPSHPGLGTCQDQNASFSSTYCWKRITLRKGASASQMQADQDRSWIWNLTAEPPRQ